MAPMCRAEEQSATIHREIARLDRQLMTARSPAGQAGRPDLWAAFKINNWLRLANYRYLIFVVQANTHDVVGEMRVQRHPSR
jgi:hypothetical protein